MSKFNRKLQGKVWCEAVADLGGGQWGQPPPPPIGSEFFQKATFFRVKGI